MIEWFRFTPESITALVEVILAVIIALYLFSIRNKSFVLRLLAISLIWESLHHFIKLVDFSVPALFQSGTSLLGITSIVIYTLLVVIAYHYRVRLYPREDKIVCIGLAVLGTAISANLLYIFVSARPHDQIPGIWITLYATLIFLILTGLLGISVLLRKAQHFKRFPVGESTHDNNKAIRACYAFIWIIVLKILIILASLLSSFEVISVGVRVYSSLIFHILYLSSLTVVIIDHLEHATSLHMKLIGLSLSTVLLILSIGGLLIYSTGSLLDQSRQFVSDRQVLQFIPAGGRYTVEEKSAEIVPVNVDTLLFGEDENIAVSLDWPVLFMGSSRDKIFVNRHGLISFDEPYQLADEPLFHLEQRSPPYKSNLHWEAYAGPAFVAALHLRARQNTEASILIERSNDTLTLFWDHFIPASQRNLDASLRIGVQIYSNGEIDILHESIDAHLFEGLIGIHAGGNGATSYFQPATLPYEQHSGQRGLIYDLSRQFRSFVHAEVLPLVWLIVGSLFFVLLIFPIALRASIIGPLNHLLDGVQRIDDGKLDVHVPVLTQDEMGNVASGFNSMMDSLQEAHQKLTRHADQLEEEVALRTSEIYQQKEILEEQAARLREIDEMKSRFFANISHEFRTPLNLIMGPLQSILDGDFGEMDGKLHHRHEVMLHESQRLLRLINQVLDLSKLEAGQMELSLESHDLVTLWRRITHSFSSRAEMEGKTLRFQSDLASMIGEVDAERMEQVGYNLIDNALKFTEAGGKVLVRVDPGPGSTALISVQDTGQGIAKDQQPYIFDRFHQAGDTSASEVRGTGIGLALVQELVYLHHGTITLESKPGFGSSFTIQLHAESVSRTELPANTPEVNVFALVDQAKVIDQDSARNSAIDKTFAPNRPRVLIVDDDEEFRLFIREYLEDDYLIEEAGNGQAGIDAALKNPPKLIVSDLVMPILDGVAFCTAAKQHPDLDHIPFILLTAKISVESRIDGLAHGADDYLGKPVNPRELKTRIQNLLDQRAKLIEKYTDMLRLEAADVVLESADAVLLKRILEVIESRLADASFSVTVLADELGMSVRDLQRKLKKLLDTGPKELITNLRIEQAKKLLGARTGTVSQIAYKVGFSRPEYFMRIFKQQTGVTPGQFMKSLK